MEEKVAVEVAELEFNRFAEKFDLDTDVKKMSEKDTDTFESNQRKIVRSIMSGHAIVEEDGTILYTLKCPEDGGALTDLKFSPPKGNIYTVTDKYKEGQNVHQLNGAIGVLTGQPPKTFANMAAIDVKFCHAVTNLFLVL